MRVADLKPYVQPVRVEIDKLTKDEIEKWIKWKDLKRDTIFLSDSDSGKENGPGVSDKKKKEKKEKREKEERKEIKEKPTKREKTKRALSPPSEASDLDDTPPGIGEIKTFEIFKNLSFLLFYE